MPPDPARDREKLEDILTAASDIAGFATGLNHQRFATEKPVQYAILHALTIIGEAANQITPALRDRYPTVPWRRIIDFRHRLVHGYSALDTELVWEVAIRLVPGLAHNIELIVATEAFE